MVNFTKLFIIGNGFDLAHGMKTKFSHFRDYLIKGYPNVCDGPLCLPECYTSPDGQYLPKKDVAVRILFKLLEDLDFNSGGEDEIWANFEEALGKFDYAELFDFFDYDEEHPFHHGYNCEDLAEDLRVTVLQVYNLFSEWVNEIDYKHSKSVYSYLINKDDLFLSFNYTHTLEEIYKIPDNRICHIHGQKGKEIIIGHNEEIRQFEELRYAGLSGSIMFKLNEALRKNVEKHYLTHKNFFNKIKTEDITDIYSVGFSFSNADMFYIQQLCEILNMQYIKWHLTEYDEDLGKNIIFKQKLNSCGFSGIFGELI